MLLPVQLAKRSYEIDINQQGMSQVGAFARGRSKSPGAFMVSDANVRRHADEVALSLQQSGFAITRQELPPGENQKCLASAALLYDRLAEINADRQTLVVAIGGGVIGDLAGFAAGSRRQSSAW
jgi:3-dehydroquinate synthase